MEISLLTNIYIYVNSIIALLFAIYLVYTMWGENLGIHNEKIDYKKYLLIIVFWALYSRTPWITTIDNINPFLIILFYLLTVLVVISGYSVSYFIFYKLLQSKKLFVSAAAIVFIVTGGEVIRSLLFSIFMLGEESSIGLVDTTNSIANALTMTPLLRLAYFGHVYYLTFILMSLVVSVFYFKVKNKLRAGIPLFLIIILIIIQLLYLKMIDIQYHKREMIVGGKEWPVTNIKFLAEGVNYDKLSEQNVLFNSLVHASSSSKNKLFSTSYYIDNENKILYKRSKQNLYPFYEYSPYILDFYYYLSNKLQSQNNIKYINKRPLPIYNIKESKEIDDFYFYKKNVDGRKTIYRWQAIICSEHYSYSFMRKIKNRDYDFVVLQSSLSMWKGSDWLYAGFVMDQKINAAYLAIPYIVVTKDGPSFDIYP